MKLTGNTVRIGTGWLTAATMLLAGIPHFDCVCPNGQHKLFCLGFFSSQTGCCCGSCSSGCSGAEGSCEAGQAPSEPRPKHSCCTRHRNGTAPPTAPGVGANEDCCKRSPAPTTLADRPSPKETRARQGAADGLGAVAQVPLASVTAVPEAASHFREHSQRPPPTDLVVELQRFLI